MSFVLSAQEMARIEKIAIGDGCSDEAFMQEAGRQVAAVVEKRAPKDKKIALLIGKGNKGGDAYVAGICLIQEGFHVDAFELYPKKECSRLNHLMRTRFEQRGGKFGDEPNYVEYGLIVDGYLGTGFKGTLEPFIAAKIQKANESGLPIVAIDIPSGLNGNNGEGSESAIRAAATVTLGCAKSGLFLRNGWNCVGELIVADFGLPAKYLKEAKLFAQIPKLPKLPRLVRNRHKYQAGYVVGYGGSLALSGAPKLAGLAALRAGAGMMRLFYPKEAKEEMHNLPLELIHCEWTQKLWQEELKRAKGVFVGPGLGRKPAVDRWLKKHLPNIEQPSVLDADALTSQTEIWPARVVLTPHRGEVLRILKLKKAPPDEELFDLCQELCDRTGAVLVLKGGPTFIFGPETLPAVVAHGDPGMATAGAGDVLTGIIAAFLAQGLTCWEAAVLGVTVHALAGEQVAKARTSYGIIASDLIEYLPKVFKELS
ncbi:MAG: NAD(P)H-hydrate dehydratase [Verrucomicrobia bacterium]|nr:NAD(P)H-hydrate dehydratase [Verrucomicrobiota bacterium]